MQLLFDRYQIREVIGEGNFGRVLRATDVTLGRDVAIKELKRNNAERGSSDYANYIRRFKREAKVQAKFTHPNIVQVIKLHDTRDTQYLVMEYVDGGDLKQYLARRGKLPPDEAVRIIKDVLAGLQTVHDHQMQIIHRDIKPSNILLTRSGTAKLADFGLAQVLDESGRTQGRGQSHPGTQAYKSPEQANSYGYLFAESDIYSTGLVLFEMLAGVPYVTVRRRNKSLSELLPKISEAVTVSLAKALAENVDERWESAGVFASSLPSASARAASRSQIPFFVIGIMIFVLTSFIISRGLNRVEGTGNSPPELPTQIVAVATDEPANTTPAILPTDTATIELTNTAEPTTTPMPSDTATPLIMTQVVEVVVIATPEPSNTPTQTPQPTATIRAIDTLRPPSTNTPQPVPSNTSTPRPLPTNTLRPVPTSTPKPQPTDTPRPTSTPNWNATLTAKAPTPTVIANSGSSIFITNNSRNLIPISSWSSPERLALGEQFSISNIRIIEEGFEENGESWDGDYAHLEMEYSYEGSLEFICIGGDLLKDGSRMQQNGRSVGYYGPTCDRETPFEGTGLVKLIVWTSILRGDMPYPESDQIKITMYGGGEPTFYSQTFNYERVWRKFQD